jgi:hypothetical protein
MVPKCRRDDISIHKLLPKYTRNINHNTSLTAALHSLSLYLCRRVVWEDDSQGHLVLSAAARESVGMPPLRSFLTSKEGT